MSAFISPIVSILPSTRANRFHQCALRTRRRATAPDHVHAVPLASLDKPDNEKKNVYDVYSNPAYGMVVPDLSAKDKEYLDNSTSDKDFMFRMTQIAHRLDRNRHEESNRIGRQTPDDYLENLSRRTKDGTLEEAASAGQRSPPTPSEPLTSESNTSELKQPSENVDNDPPEVPNEESVPQSLDDVDAKIAELQRQLMEAAQAEQLPDFPTPDTNVPNIETPEELAAAAEQLDTLQKQIRLEAGLDKPDDPEPSPKFPEAVPKAVESQASNTVDKQIQYLENYLEKMKQEAVEEGDAEKLAESTKASKTTDEVETSDSDLPEKVNELVNKVNDKVTLVPGTKDKEDVKITGLQDKPGELSAEEKQAAFLELRRRAMEARGESQIDNPFETEGVNVEPFNVQLPEKKLRRGTSGDFTMDSLHTDASGKSAREREVEFAEMRSPSMDINNPKEGMSDPLNTTLAPSTAALNEDGDVPLGNEDEYDSFGPMIQDKKLLIDEIENETKDYVRESRRILQLYESRLNLLITKLKASEE